jgi:hypothetical protein
MPRWASNYKAPKREMRYGVFMHIPNRNGYVVRSGYVEADGKAYYPNPYNDQKPVAEFKV